ncbi:MAG: 16S rRNA (uracil(1498)-N(3))-methyltransferase [Candidatus Sulfobium sp.]|jgi:16S rRNA (uracil1498-N3)-methyltransferase
MNLILLFPRDFVGEGRVRLEGRRFRHVKEIHRASVGDELHVGLAGSLAGRGRVIELRDGLIEMDVDLFEEPPAPLPVTLVLALPRPKVLRRVLSSVTSMGVKKIALTNSWRVEKSFWQSPLLEADKVNSELVRGLEQARDTVMPEVLIRPLFRPFVEDELPEIVEGTVPLVAHPSATRECPRQSGGRVTLAIGPEGGFIDYEIEKLTECGFSAVSLGSRILTVETVIPFVVGRLFQIA